MTNIWKIRRKSRDFPNFKLKKSQFCIEIWHDVSHCVHCISLLTLPLSVLATGFRNNSLVVYA